MIPTSRFIQVYTSIASWVFVDMARAAIKAPNYIVLGVAVFVGVICTFIALTADVEDKNNTQED